MTNPEHLAESLAHAATDINPDHLDAAWKALVESARVSVPGFDHVGISTFDATGRPETRASTGPLVQLLDDIQYEINEGPCVSALREAVVVTAPDVGHDQRWPRYVRRATSETGLQSQLAVRIFLDGGVLGGLNLYSTSRSDIDPDAETVAVLFAAHAAAMMGHVSELANLHKALESRQMIGQAVGILMERYQMNADRAFAFLIRASSHGNVKLRDVAQEIVDQVNEKQQPSAVAGS